MRVDVNDLLESGAALSSGFILMDGQCVGQLVGEHVEVFIGLEPVVESAILAARKKKGGGKKRCVEFWSTVPRRIDEPDAVVTNG